MIADPKAELTTSLRRNLLAGSTAALLLFGGVGGWAAGTELSGAVIATGSLVVDGNVKRVQHSTGGIVANLPVREGQFVAAGETIVTLDPVIPKANLAAISKSLVQLYAREARLEAELKGLPSVQTPSELRTRLSGPDAEMAMATERRLFEDRRVSRTGQKARLREQVVQQQQQIEGFDVQQKAKSEEIKLIDAELDGIRQLYEKGLTTLNRVNTLERNATRLHGERGALISSIASSKGRISEIELQFLQVDQTMRAEAAAEIRDVENKQSELVEQEIKAREMMRQVEIKAPITGVIHRLSIHTVGGVISPAEVLMEIVPQSGDLVAEARIAPQDIDQVMIGQKALLRLSAFNRNTTPELSGSVIRVSADLEIDQKSGAGFYRAAISIPESERARLSELELVPGMPVEAFVQTGRRTVLSYLTKPVRDHAARAFRED